jgi:hypothetical protein
MVVRVKQNLGKGDMGVARGEELRTSPLERWRMEEWKKEASTLGSDSRSPVS